VFSFEEILMAAFIYLLDVSSELEETQEEGIVFVFDLKGLSFDHARNVGLQSSKKI
jgi:hypothetical protein